VEEKSQEKSSNIKNKKKASENGIEKSAPAKESKVNIDKDPAKRSKTTTKKENVSSEKTKKTAGSEKSNTDSNAKDSKRNSKTKEKDTISLIKSLKPSGKAKHEIEIEGNALALTNLKKVYWPDEKYTKGDLIEYYSSVSKFILPYLKDRPESLHRHPNGINNKSFFHKDMSSKLPDWIETVVIRSESNNKDINYLVCQNEATLIYMNNLGCIEINPWNSRRQSQENPDYTVIDLDPADNTFDEVIETALVVKSILDKAGAESFIKTSGASGMHIYIPLGAKYDYEQGRNFAHIIAQLANAELPDLTSIERSPKARPKSIYLDYLQNRMGQTLASAYSVRPKPGATVSTPLDWKEVKIGLHPSQFTIKTVPQRLKKTGDLFKGVLVKGINMEKCLTKLGG
jgi:bifunctional non-homologous end joining protein LigD